MEKNEPEKKRLDMILETEKLRVELVRLVVEMEREKLSLGNVITKLNLFNEFIKTGNDPLLEVADQPLQDGS